MKIIIQSFRGKFNENVFNLQSFCNKMFVGGVSEGEAECGVGRISRIG
jgi:hypothetical protein